MKFTEFVKKLESQVGTASHTLLQGIDADAIGTVVTWHYAGGNAELCHLGSRRARLETRDAPGSRNAVQRTFMYTLSEGDVRGCAAEIAAALDRPVRS